MRVGLIVAASALISGQARSEQKNEDAALRAKRATEEKSGTDGRSGTSAQGDRRENPPARPGER
jgi:hypothetical protein